MNKLEQAAAERAERRVQIEPLMGVYPDLPEDDLQRLLGWYRDEASSHDIAMLSLKTEIAEGYTRFRADHIDRITWSDYLKFCVSMLGLFAILAALLWMGMG